MSDADSPILSEPYLAQDGQWQIRSYVSNEVHNFATSEDAYHFYHRINEVQARLDGGSRTDLTRPPLTEPVKLPLSKVPETRPAHLDTPILTDAEELDATERRIKLGVARNDLRDIEAGKTPAKYKYPIITGISAALIIAATYLTKC